MKDKLKDYKISIYFAFVALFILVVVCLIYLSIKSDLFKENKNGVLTKNISKSEQALNAWRQSNEQIKIVRKLDKTDYYIGKGDLEMIVYYDFECPFSARFNEVVKKVIAQYGNDVKIGFRSFPLSIHDHAVTASIAFECAVADGQGQEMINALFANQGYFGDKSFFIDLAKKIGLKESKFTKCLDDKKIQDKVDFQKNEAVTFGVIGTPHFFLNGKGYPGAWQFNDFTDSAGYKQTGLVNIIDNLLKKK